MSPLAPATGPWTLQHARHLMQRAGFGVQPERLTELVAMGREAAVDRLIEESLRAPRPGEQDWLPAMPDRAQLQQELRGLPPEEAQRRRNQLVRENREAVKLLEIWWLERMAAPEAPLREKLALFWHSHFATSAQKVRAARLSYEMYGRLWWNGMGSFRELTMSVAKSPAMMIYLDNIQNRRSQPNENFARELFELFTLGIGNYTETDIREAARAFTGWTVVEGEFRFNRRQHDPGRKTIFGRSGNFGGEDVVDLVMQHPAMSRWITGKLFAFFVHDHPSEELRRDLAAAFVEERLVIWRWLRRVFLSEEFYSPQAMGTRIKSPAEFVTALQIDLATPIEENVILNFAMQSLGQELFFPPNVRGWQEGRAWINTNTLLMRVNLVNYMVSGLVPNMAGPMARRFRELAREAPPSAQPAARRTAAGWRERLERRRAMLGESANLSDDPREPSMMESMMQDPDGGEAPEALRVAPPLNLEAFMAGIPHESAETLLNALIERFLGPDRQLDAAQRQVLLEEARRAFVPAGHRPLAQTHEHQRGLLRMILSLAEYQLC